MNDNDPLLWLDDIDGPRALAWVRAENARSLALLESDPRYPALLAEARAVITAADRIPYPSFLGDDLVNFWQDEARVRGLWRRTTLGSFRAAEPHWETLLDIDALAAAEGRNWVFHGVVSLPPEYRRCLVALSDGGKDASELREFDLASRRFAANGFALSEAKQNAVWLDGDTLLVARDWGPGTLTASGYPFIVKKVRRGAPLDAAEQIFAGAASDVSVGANVLRDPDGTVRGVGINRQVKLPKNASMHMAATSNREDRAFIDVAGFLDPNTLWLVEPEAGGAAPVKSLPARFDASGDVVEQFEATSKDGTRVPYFVIRPASLRADGSAPTLLYGYGGFQVSLTPSYLGATGRLWLEKGGVYVVANIRGGGEFGPEWHQAALKSGRRHAFEDFIAVAEDLIRRDITSPRRLGIMGGSNGGLLMGVMLTQRPDLFHAIVIQVPLLDMLRYHKLLAGASWIAEYGDPDIPDEAAFLESISPYHNLKPGVAYPEPFFVTSTKDDRVHPGHARKMAARMQALGRPFLYYENIDGGHSAAANLEERARRTALEFTYLARQLMD